MLDRTSVIGGYYENGSAIFILYACVPKGNHAGFIHSCVFPRCSARIPFPGHSEENFPPCPAWQDRWACGVPCNARTGGVYLFSSPFRCAESRHPGQHPRAVTHGRIVVPGPLPGYPSGESLPGYPPLLAGRIRVACTGRIDPYRFIAGCSIGDQAVFFSPGPGEVPDAEYHDVSR